MTTLSKTKKATDYSNEVEKKEKKNFSEQKQFYTKLITFIFNRKGCIFH